MKTPEFTTIDWRPLFYPPHFNAVCGWCWTQWLGVARTKEDAEAWLERHQMECRVKS